MVPCTAQPSCLVTLKAMASVFKKSRVFKFRLPVEMEAIVQEARGEETLMSREHPVYFSYCSEGVADVISGLQPVCSDFFFFFFKVFLK